MWAVAPETEGVSCEIDDPIARELCKRPELRGMKPLELARILRVSPAAAQMGILKLAAQTTGKRIVFEGLSFDEAISGAGKVAPKGKLEYASDAGALDVVIQKAKEAAPVIVAVLVLVGIALDRKSES